MYTKIELWQACILSGIVSGLICFMSGVSVGEYETHRKIIENPQGYINAVVNASNEKIRQEYAAQNIKELEKSQ